MKITVAVPYWNRQPALDRLFADLALHYADLPLEISVCDDGSDPPAVVPDGVILTRLPAKRKPLNPCVPINRAVAASTGDIIVLTNPEVEHRESVLPHMLAMLNGPLDYVTARCMDTDGMLLAGDGVDYTTHGRLPVPPGAHFHFLAMFRRTLWDAAGGFDEDYRYVQASDDNDFLFRVWKAGAVFKHCPIPVYHRRSGIRWNMPHGRSLFFQKWPEAKGMQ
jgi:hypothetical protein